MKNRIFQLSLMSMGTAAFFSQIPSAWAVSQVTSIQFNGTADPNEITIQADGPVTFEKQENTQDNQVIVELKGAHISGANSRKIDTSSFNSKVSLISPYQVLEQPDMVRVVVQLRQSGSVDVSQDGNVIHVKVPNGGTGSSPPAPAAAAAPASEAPPATDAAGAPIPPPNPDGTTSAPPAPSADASPAPDPAAPAAPGATAAAGASTAPASTEPKSKVDEFLDNKTTQKFTGKLITLEVRDADVGDVLRLIGDASGFNMLVGDAVKGKVTLSLVDVPWDQALDVIIHTLHLGAERAGNILRVETLQSLTAEKIEEFKAQRAAEASSPRVTKIFPISYATLGDITAVINKFASSTASGGSAVSETGAPLSIVQSDNRTNSIIVRDLPENIERMKKLIEVLDTQTPQVMIEAKVVEATESFGKSLTGSLGTGFQNTNTVLASAGGGDPTDALLGASGVFSNGASFASASAGPIGTLGLSPSVSFLPGVTRLNAVLNWGESESLLKVVASPKTVVLNKEHATIIEGTPILVPGTTFVAGVGTVPTTTIQTANVSLGVTPTVTNDGSVLLDLSVSKDTPVSVTGGSAVGSRNMTTKVLVESGTTLVIGGIYTLQTNSSDVGVPFFKDIPILGWFFASKSDSTARSELFIFVTPRILNPKEAGIGG